MVGLGLVTLSAVVLVYVIATAYFSPVTVRVIVACMANNNTQLGKSCDEQVAPPPLRIQDNDKSLEQTPKLKEALLNASLVHPNTSGNREYVMEMTRSEFDIMNRFLVNADPDGVRKSYSSLPKPSYMIDPTSTLWPKSAMAVTVSYQGNVYELHAEYLGVF
jgi:hypothetical protein